MDVARPPGDLASAVLGGVCMRWVKLLDPAGGIGNRAGGGLRRLHPCALLGLLPGGGP